MSELVAPPGGGRRAGVSRCGAPHSPRGAATPPRRVVSLASPRPLAPLRREAAHAPSTGSARRRRRSGLARAGGFSPRGLAAHTSSFVEPIRASTRRRGRRARRRTPGAAALLVELAALAVPRPGDGAPLSPAHLGVKLAFADRPPPRRPRHADVPVAASSRATTARGARRSRAARLEAPGPASRATPSNLCAGRRGGNLVSSIQALLRVSARVGLRATSSCSRAAARASARAGSPKLARARKRPLTTNPGDAAPRRRAMMAFV